MRCTASAIGLVLGASGALAQIDPAAHGPIDHARVVELVDQLGSEDWATRQRAEQYLLLTPNEELEFIEQKLSDASISAEQRIRLERVGGRIFRKLPHAAMGIRFVNSNNNDTPAILEPLRDFDAYRVLQSGDVVTEMEGASIRDVGELKAAIISRQPGDVVKIQVMRGERMVNVEFKLGDYAALQNQRLNDSDVYAAWQWRVARSAERAGNDEEAHSAIVPQFEPFAELPVQTATTNFSPTIYQFGAAIAIGAGQPLATPDASAYRPNSNNVGQRGRRNSGGESRNRDEIIRFEAQIESNRRKISLLEQRITAIDTSLKTPHKEEDRKRLVKIRAQAAQQITALTVDSARLSRFLDALRR